MFAVFNSPHTLQEEAQAVYSFPEIQESPIELIVDLPVMIFDGERLVPGKIYRDDAPEYTCIDHQGFIHLCTLMCYDDVHDAVVMRSKAAPHSKKSAGYGKVVPMSKKLISDGGSISK